MIPQTKSTILCHLFTNSCLLQILELRNPDYLISEFTILNIVELALRRRTIFLFLMVQCNYLINFIEKSMISKFQVKTKVPKH